MEARGNGRLSGSSKDSAADRRLIEEVEITLMLEGLYKIHGFDFRNYSLPFVRKRIRELCQREGVFSVSSLQERVFRNQKTLNQLIETLTISTTSMFKDPDFYLALRDIVIPMLKHEPQIKIWQVGCSTGEEAFSLAILLEEEGIYDRCRIYATDANFNALKKARSGIQHLGVMKQYTENYLASGAKAAFSEYYTANYDCAKFNPSLQRNIIFGMHNIATDSYFNEFHLVLLRDMLVQFNEVLRERVLSLVHESLTISGVLALGKWETLRSSSIERCYRGLDETHKLYRRFCA